MSFTPFGIQIGPVLLYYFGLILLVALIVGGYFARLRARDQGQDIGLVIDVLTWALIIGIIFARAAYVLNPPPSVAAVYDRRWFLAHPFDLQIGPLAVWSGGLGMAGALLGGLVGGLTVLLRRRADVWRWVDILAPAALLGIFVAGWANIANQQMYGPPTSLAWGLPVTNPVPPYTAGLRFHPTPAYLAIWALLCLVAVLAFESSLRPRSGIVALLTLILYLPGMILADFLRLDVNRLFLGLTDAQLVSAILFLIVIILFIVRWRTVSEELPDPPPVRISSRDAH